MRNYRELTRIQDFDNRYRYLRIHSTVGNATFGSNRYLNQAFYTSDEWKHIRKLVIDRDGGCDLAIPDREIDGLIIVHHIEPITYQDLVEMTDKVIDLDNLVCVSPQTHRAIHYGDERLLLPDYKPRRPNDTCPWRG